MDMRPVIALFMGLIIQLSQVQLAAATDTAEPCHREGSASCCADRQSCPCAEESDRDQKPAPSVPAGHDSKWIISRTTDPNKLEAFVSPPADTGVLSSFCLEPKSGYQGVPLSVAFCRFVI
jgi:hypothetical protein